MAATLRHQVACPSSGLSQIELRTQNLQDACEAESESETVPKLCRGEIGSVHDVGGDGEPRPGLFGSDESALVLWD